MSINEVLSGVPSLTSPSGIRSCERASLMAYQHGAIRASSSLYAHMVDALDRTSASLALISESSEPIRYERTSRRLTALSASVARLRAAGVRISAPASLRTQMADGPRMAALLGAAQHVVSMASLIGVIVPDAPSMSVVTDDDLAMRASAIVSSVRDSLACESMALAPVSLPVAV